MSSKEVSGRRCSVAGYAGFFRVARNYENAGMSHAVVANAFVSAAHSVAAEISASATGTISIVKPRGRNGRAVIMIKAIRADLGLAYAPIHGGDNGVNVSVGNASSAGDDAASQ